MNDALSEIGNSKLPSVLNDPFKKSQIKRVYVSMFQSSFSGEWFASGSIEFKNGSTTGKQEFEGATFDDVVGKIKAFITEIQ